MERRTNDDPCDGASCESGGAVHSAAPLRSCRACEGERDGGEPEPECKDRHDDIEVDDVGRRKTLHEDARSQPPQDLTYL